ncbi:flagellar basal body-associated FliL family protein [Halodesulfovibrio marinisediminis]|uniref:Flagellar protein FliL n=1 Tax=Halodesulfovibrio marinisediminis DSM 17456 TaxID=1121457 RepID=A0A1N6J1R1_9BACT|nr:flagellar basal body-associated FliL family protein [Halodesulfovibrio marinisediminis]SIO38175.1 flagellar FliL protein [Halodesulfovibrio marinisediminis DSM 17456]
MANDPTNRPGSAGIQKAQLDMDTLSTPGSMMPNKDDKVELDLDDAPFLMDDEDEEEEQVFDDATPTDVDSFSSPAEFEAASDAARKRKRKLMFGGLGLLVIALIAVGWNMLQPQDVPRPVKRVVKKEKGKYDPPPIVQKDKFDVTWEPFWVEQRDNKKEIRFLVCKFAVFTDNEKLAWEAKNKKVTLRDAIFYYLRNKDLKFLSDKENVQLLKSDLLTVVNQYMGHGQFKDVFIENYLVK